MPWIDETLRFIGQGWVGTLLGLGFGVLSLIIYFRTRARTKLSYVFAGEHLLGSSSHVLPPEISVRYGGMIIPRVTKSHIIFWNSGENTVHRTDIVAKDPLRLQIGSDGRILSVSILKTSRKVNEVIVGPSDKLNESIFSFDFLDAHDGAVVEILHTSAERKPSIQGTLKGLPQGFSAAGQFARPKPQMKIRKGRLAAVVGPIFMAICGFLYAVSSYLPSDKSSDIAGSLAGAILGFISMWLLDAWVKRRKYPRSLHLETLE